MYSLTIVQEGLLKCKKWGRKRKVKYSKEYHRKLKPAVSKYDENNVLIIEEYWFDGYIYFFEKGIFFRIDFTNRTSEYHSSDDEPSVIYPNGTKEWHWGGKLHRGSSAGGRPPAVIYSNGDCEWWSGGKRHNSNGPAVVYGNKKYWFDRGSFVQCIV